MSAELNHLSVAALWACRNELSAFSSNELQHLIACENCARILAICMMSKDVQEVAKAVEDMIAGSKSAPRR